MKIDTKKEILEYINNLQGYVGYVQFSHREIEAKDIFADTNPKVEDEAGFVYEAHFCNAKQSISIKQINDGWLISKTDISKIDDKDTQTYFAVNNLKVKMAQIWQEQEDELCENMEVKKLTKVVFAGFEKGESK